MVNPRIFEKKKMIICTSKGYMFPLQSDNVFKPDTRSPVLSRKPFVCTTSVPSHACSSSVPTIAVPASNCKNDVIL